MSSSSSGLLAGAAEQEEDLLGPHPRYTRVRDISRGGFGAVMLALDRITGQQVALKFVKRGPDFVANVKYIEREIVNQLKLKHPLIIALHEVFLTDSHLVLAMEYAAGGDLLQFITHRRFLKEEEARWFFQQVALAVHYSHGMGVSSRDLKLENTLLDSSPWPAVKLADWGLSKDTDAHSLPKTRVGTPAYLAPEIVRNMPGQPYDGQKCDLWSCGVLLYTLLYKQYPFSRQGDSLLAQPQVLKVMLERIVKADYSFPATRQLSGEARDLISRLLVVDPTQRISLEDILAHPWFVKDLVPGAVRCNSALVQESLTNLPSAEMLQDVHDIVQEACLPPHHPNHAMQEQQQQPPAQLAYKQHMQLALQQQQQR